MTIFKDGKVLNVSYIPTTDLVLFRDKEVSELNVIFETFGTMPMTVTVFGNPGTGKTTIIKRLMEDKLKKMKPEERIVYVNVSKDNTELMVMNEIMYQLNAQMGSRSMADYNRAFTRYMESFGCYCLIILDEFEKLYEKRDGKSLLIKNLIDTQGVSLLLVTNSIKGLDYLKSVPEIASRLTGNKIIFHPYVTEQINDILLKRASKAFIDEIIEAPLTKATIHKISGMISYEHGDVRKAIQFLFAVSQIAERNKTGILPEYVEKAKETSDETNYELIINAMPPQVQIALLSLTDLWDANNGKEGKPLRTEFDVAELYDRYKENCSIESRLDKVVTVRRFNDLLYYIENSGFTRTKVNPKSKGRNKVIMFDVLPNSIRKILYKIYGLPEERGRK